MPKKRPEHIVPPQPSERQAVVVNRLVDAYAHVAEAGHILATIAAESGCGELVPMAFHLDDMAHLIGGLAHSYHSHGGGPSC